MTTKQQQLMMLDIDYIFTKHQATPTDLLTVAQAIAVSAIGDLTNKAGSVPGNHNVQSSMANGQSSMVNGQCSMDSLHRLADGIADQIRTALHLRINEGRLPEW